MSNTVTLTYDRIVRETEAASLYEFDGVEVWLPKSQVEDSPSTTDEGGEIELPEWLATRNGLV